MRWTCLSLPLTQPGQHNQWPWPNQPASPLHCDNRPSREHPGVRIIFSFINSPRGEYIKPPRVCKPPRCTGAQQGASYDLLINKSTSNGLTINKAPASMSRSWVIGWIACGRFRSNATVAAAFRMCFRFYTDTARPGSSKDGGPSLTICRRNNFVRD